MLTPEAVIKAAQAALGTAKGHYVKLTISRMEGREPEWWYELEGRSPKDDVFSGSSLEEVAEEIKQRLLKEEQDD
jgi:hypothetical protein